VTQFPIILLNDLSFPSLNDVIRPRPLGASALCGMPCSHVGSGREFGVRFLVWNIQATGMTLNWSQWKKLETRHTVEGSFGNEFRSITIAELWRPEVAKRWKIWFFLRIFLDKTTPHKKIFKILFWQNSSWHRSTCCFQILWNLADGKLVKSCVAYLTKISPDSPALATVQITPKICRGQPPRMYSECSRFHPNQFTFSGVIDECENTVKMYCKVNPIFGFDFNKKIHRLSYFFSTLYWLIFCEYSFSHSSVIYHQPVTCRLIRLQLINGIFHEQPRVVSLMTSCCHITSITNCITLMIQQNTTECRPSLAILRDHQST